MRHRRMLAPINSVKHYVQMENASIASAARRSFVLIDATAAPATSTTADVKEGSIVKNVFIESWVKSVADAGTDTKFQFAIEKVPAGQTPLTFAQMNNLQAYDNKKNILYYSQGVLGDKTTNSIPIVRNWFKIPKGKQRMGLGDRLIVAISATGFALSNCGFSTYKEYT